jgi:ABC-2 type transport system permease protein
MQDTDAQVRLDRLETLELKPVGPQQGLVTGTASSVRDILQYRELLVLLIRRELRARYKNSSLGGIWSLVKPIAQLLIYFIVIGQFLGAARGIPEFAIFVFSGLTMWALFNETVSGGAGSVVANSGLIKKVYLPREVFPLSVVGGALFTLATQFVVLAVALVVTGTVPTGPELLYAPLALAVLLVFGTAFGLVLAAVNVYLRDVQYLVEIAMTVLFWASPIVYSWALVRQAISGSTLQQFYLGNPVTAAVLGMQRALWVGGHNEPYPDGLATRLFVMLGIGLVLLWCAQRLFARLEANFAQEI